MKGFFEKGHIYYDFTQDDVNFLHNNFPILGFYHIFDDFT